MARCRSSPDARLRAARSASCWYVAERYCGHCKVFHEDLYPPAREWFVKQAKVPRGVILSNPQRMALLDILAFYMRTKEPQEFLDCSTGTTTTTDDLLQLLLLMKRG